MFDFYSFVVIAIKGAKRKTQTQCNNSIHKNVCYVVFVFVSFFAQGVLKNSNAVKQYRIKNQSTRQTNAVSASWALCVSATGVGCACTGQVVMRAYNRRQYLIEMKSLNV